MPHHDAFQPRGHTTVAPWVVTDDTAGLLDFFDGNELARVATADGSIGHAEVRVGDTVVLAFDRRLEWPPMPSLLRIWVPDSDAAVQRAVEAGATVITPLSTNAFGQRGARIRDPWGNVWRVETRVEQVPEDDMWSRLQQPRYAEGVRIAQETLDAELSGQAQQRPAESGPGLGPVLTIGPADVVWS